MVASVAKGYGDLEETIFLARYLQISWLTLWTHLRDKRWDMLSGIKNLPPVPFWIDWTLPNLAVTLHLLVE